MKTNVDWKLLVLLACIELLAAKGLSAQGVSFQGLGQFPGGTGRGAAYGVSGDGTTAVGDSRTDGYAPFRWTETTEMHGLGGLIVGGKYGKSWATNQDGSVVVGQAQGGIMPQAFRWTPATGMVGLGYLGGDTASDSTALGVSDDGQVVVGSARDSSGTQAIRWTPATGMVGLGDFPTGAKESFAWDVSDDGSVIVGAGRTQFGRVAFRWTEPTGMVSIDVLPGTANNSNTIATAVSSDGNVIAGWGDSPSNIAHSFRWTAETGLVQLAEPADITDPMAFGISGNGNVIVGRGTRDEAVYQVAFIWDPQHGMRSLESALVNEYGFDLQGWKLTEAWDVSDDGLTIVGAGINPLGEEEPFIVHLPEPSTGCLAILAITLAGIARGNKLRSL